MAGTDSEENLPSGDSGMQSPAAVVGLVPEQTDAVQRVLACPGEDVGGGVGREGAVGVISELFSSPEHLAGAFCQPWPGEGKGHSPGQQQQHQPNPLDIHFSALRLFYERMRGQGQDNASASSDTTAAVLSASSRLLHEQPPLAPQPGEGAATVQLRIRRQLRSYLIILANPALLEPENQPLLRSLAKSLVALKGQERAQVVATLSSAPAEVLEEMVATVQQCITLELYEAGRVTELVQLSTQLLQLLYDANLKAQLLPVSAFYNDAVNNKDLVDPDKQYLYWKKPHRYAFSFCHFPFILDLSTKWRILQLDSRAEMHAQFQRAILDGLFSAAGFIEPFFVLRVRRANLIHDAITHIQRNREDLKKPLRVQFVGEDAVDEGGVRKEFFQLVVQELFDPKYGMFGYSSDTRLFWFSLQPGELEQLQRDSEQQAEEEQRCAQGMSVEGLESPEEKDLEAAKGRATGSQGQTLGTAEREDGGNGPPTGSQGGPLGGSTCSSTAAPLMDAPHSDAAPSNGGGAAVGVLAGRLEQGPNAGAPGVSHMHKEEDEAGGRGDVARSSPSRGLGAEDIELRKEYELVGMLLGLAIYNSCILDVHLPTVVYKKLLGRPLALKDLDLVDSGLAKGLQDLLAFEGDVEEVYSRMFQVSVEDVYGYPHHIDLKPGGSHIALTADNREEYVQLCIKFYLDTSVGRQFEAFSDGFKHLIPEPMLKLFEPEELELLICGTSHLDFQDLQRGAQYTDGYVQGHKTIEEFWEVTSSFSEQEKKNLLMFVTGCDRAPIQGLASLHFTISRNGPDSDRLPTAHTCFNHLLLPEYSSKDKLKARLLTAINNAQGFGLR